MSILKDGKNHSEKDTPRDDVTAEHLENGTASSNGAATSAAAQSEEETDKRWWAKFKTIPKRVYKVKVIGLIIILIGYSFLGAWLFSLIESKHEQRLKKDISETREEIIQELIATSMTSRVRVVTEEKLKELLIDYEGDIMAAYKAGVTSSSTVEVWGFWDSLFFCGTVYSTIGYGNIAPVTDLGRGLCMLYAAIGIPLALLVLAEVGRRFTVFVKFLWAFVRRFYYTGSWRKIRKPFRKTYVVKDDSRLGIKQKETVKGDSESSKSDDSQSESGSKDSKKLVYGYEVDENFNLPITVAVVILIIYILLGAFMYTWWEKWTYLESFYFVFISISTIGFGDVLPEHPKFFILSSVYIFIGLSLVSMCINVAIEFFSATADKAKEKMGEAKKKIGEKYTEARGRVQQVGQDIRSNIRDETDRIKQFRDEQFDRIGEKMTGARDRVHQVGKDIRSNIINETGGKIKQFKDDKIKKWVKSRSRSNTPTPNESESMGDRKFSLPEDVHKRVDMPSCNLKGSVSAIRL